MSTTSATHRARADRIHAAATAAMARQSARQAEMRATLDDLQQSLQACSNMSCDERCVSSNDQDTPDDARIAQSEAEASRLMGESVGRQLAITLERNLELTVRNAELTGLSIGLEREARRLNHDAESHVVREREWAAKNTRLSSELQEAQVGKPPAAVAQFVTSISTRHRWLAVDLSQPTDAEYAELLAWVGRTRHSLAFRGPTARVLECIAACPNDCTWLDRCGKRTVHEYTLTDAQLADVVSMLTRARYAVTIPTMHPVAMWGAFMKAELHDAVAQARARGVCISWETWAGNAQTAEHCANLVSYSCYSLAESHVTILCDAAVAHQVAQAVWIGDKYTRHGIVISVVVCTV